MKSKKGQFNRCQWFVRYLEKKKYNCALVLLLLKTIAMQVLDTPTREVVVKTKKQVERAQLKGKLNNAIQWPFWVDL